MVTILREIDARAAAVGRTDWTDACAIGTNEIAAAHLIAKPTVLFRGRWVEARAPARDLTGGARDCAGALLAGHAGRTRNAARAAVGGARLGVHADAVAIRPGRVRADAGPALAGGSPMANDAALTAVVAVMPRENARAATHILAKGTVVLAHPVVAELLDFRKVGVHESRRQGSGAGEHECAAVPALATVFGVRRWINAPPLTGHPPTDALASLTRPTGAASDTASAAVTCARRKIDAGSGARRQPSAAGRFAEPIRAHRTVAARATARTTVRWIAIYIRAQRVASRTHRARPSVAPASVMAPASSP